MHISLVVEFQMWNIFFFHLFQAAIGLDLESNAATIPTTPLSADWLQPEMRGGETKI